MSVRHKKSGRRHFEKMHEIYVINRPSSRFSSSQSVTDPFVKLWLSTSSSDSTTLTCGGSGKRGVIGGSSGSGRKSRRTGVRKRTLHPVFQEAFLFPLEACDVDTIVVHLQVIDYDRFVNKPYFFLKMRIT